MLMMYFSQLILQGIAVAFHAHGSRYRLRHLLVLALLVSLMMLLLSGLVADVDYIELDVVLVSLAPQSYSTGALINAWLTLNAWLCFDNANANTTSK